MNKTRLVRIISAGCCLMALETAGLAPSSAAPPPSGQYACLATRPQSPSVDVTNVVPAGDHMVVIPAQVAFDACKLASVFDLGPSEPIATSLERMRTIAREAHFLVTCPHQNPADSGMQKNPDFLDTQDWGCGPYLPENQAPATFAPLNYTCQIGPVRPDYAPPQGLVAIFGTHPPVGKAQMLYDLCIAAYELSVAGLGKASDPYVLTSANDPGGFSWDLRFAHLYAEVSLYLNCTNGRTGYPPLESDPNFAATRDFGCGPYK